MSTQVTILELVMLLNLQLLEQISLVILSQKKSLLIKTLDRFMEQQFLTLLLKWKLITLFNLLVPKLV